MIGVWQAPAKKATVSLSLWAERYECNTFSHYGWHIAQSNHIAGHVKHGVPLPWIRDTVFRIFFDLGRHIKAFWLASANRYGKAGVIRSRITEKCKYWQITMCYISAGRPVLQQWIPQGAAGLDQIKVPHTGKLQFVTPYLSPSYPSTLFPVDT